MAVPALGPLLRSWSGTGTEIFRLPGGQGPGIVDVMWGMGAMTAGMMVSNLVAHAGAWLSLLLPLALWKMTVIGRDRVGRWRFPGVPLVARVGAWTGPDRRRVRIVGTIEPLGDTMTAPGADVPAVYARSVFWQADRNGRTVSLAREDVRGVPFGLRLADGALVHLRVEDVNVRDRPIPLIEASVGVRRTLGAASRGWLFGRELPVWQARLSPGDRVEAIGRLRSEVNPQGEASPGRGVPLLHRLVPVPGHGIWMRRLRM